MAIFNHTLSQNSYDTRRISSGTILSLKILTIQEGYPRGVKIPYLALTGFYSGRVAMAHLPNPLDIPRELCKGLTKC